jgi:outer membrane lipoprotein-sorting protein
MTARWRIAVVVTLVALVCSSASAERDAPPSNLIAGDPARGAAVDPVFAYLKLDRLRCKFTEEKHIALLARPLRSTGTIYFERDKGIARITATPKPQHVVLTATSLRIRTAKRTEEIPLDKSKDLKAFAMVFPTLLRGQRAELERTFEIGLYGSQADWWALTFTPRPDSLRKLVRRVVVFGRKTSPVSLQVTEASGDTTDTRLTDILTDGAVPDTEIATAFGAP